MEEVKEELLRIAQDNDGLLRPVDVVACARKKSSPLHGCFTWDDGVAGELYRLEEARRLIRVNVQVVGEVADAVRVFVSLTTDRTPEGGYRQLVAVLSHDEQRAQLLRDALAELETFRKKYAVLHELAEVFQAFERIKT